MRGRLAAAGLCFALDAEDAANDVAEGLGRSDGITPPLDAGQPAREASPPVRLERAALSAMRTDPVLAQTDDPASDLHLLASTLAERLTGRKRSREEDIASCADALVAGLVAASTRLAPVAAIARAISAALASMSLPDAALLACVTYVVPLPHSARPRIPAQPAARRRRRVVTDQLPMRAAAAAMAATVLPMVCPCARARVRVSRYANLPR